MNTGKELVKQARIEKANEKLNPTKDISVESEVIALSNYGKPFTHTRTQEMIAKQKESRRDRHIKTLNDFGKWTESLSKDVIESYADIKFDIERAFEQQDKDLHAYFQTFTDKELLRREKDILDELIKVVKVSRRRGVANLLTIYACTLGMRREEGSKGGQPGPSPRGS